jgi:hypothetical protein
LAYTIAVPVDSLATDELTIYHLRASHYRNNNFTLAKSLSPLLFLLLVGLCNTSYGQFRGNLDLQAAHSTNVEGLDSPSPDNILQPLIDLRYSLPVDRTTFTLQGRYQPNFFLKENKRSFHYGYVALTGATRLSNGTVTSSVLAAAQSQDPTVLRITTILDSISLISRRETTISQASSITSTVFVLKELLSEEGYSETMKEVIIEELEKIKNHDEVLRSKPLITKLDASLVELNSIVATEDDLYLSNAPLSQIQDGGVRTTTAKSSSAMLVIPDDIGFNDISHNNLYISEDLLGFSSTMNAPRLSVTLESELQENSKTYSSFSYHTIKIHPNFTTNISTVLLGAHYYFTDVNYPNDTLYKYTEHRLWGDLRFEIADGLASVSSVGIGFRNNPYPLQIHIRTLPPNPAKIDLVAQSKFTQLSLGSGILYSMSERITIGLFGKLTLNPNIDSLAYSASANQANKSAGPLSTNTYAYDKYGGILSLQTRLPFDIDLGATFDYERRRYPTFKIVRTFNRREVVVSSTRNDDMYYVSATIAKPFFPASDRFAALFTGITPIIDLRYSKLSSSVSTFSYEDLTTTLNISFDF